MTRIRLLAFDIDGTLSLPGDPVPEAVLGSLRQCVTAGILLIPATGKKHSSIRSLCRDIGLTGVAVTCNGALTVDANTGRVQDACYLGRAGYKQTLRRLEDDKRFSLAVFTDQDIVCTSRTFASEALHAIGEPTSRFVTSFHELDGAKVAKVLAASPREGDLYAGLADYAPQLSGVSSVTVTSRQFLEFMAPNVSKGTAVAEIARCHSVKRAEIACIGDSDNDLSLFEVSGMGFAVANATPSVLAAARTIVPSAGEAGVAHAIQEYILGEQHGPKR